MGNPHRGEATFTAFDQEWTLRFNTNALSEFEGLTGLKLHHLKNGSGITELRALVYAGLGKHHRRKRTGLEYVGDMIDEVGTLEMGQIVSKAMETAFPQPEGDDESPHQAAQNEDGSTS